VPPAAKASGGDFEWRYLNPPASAVLFGEQRMDVAAHRLLRDGVHYRAELFEVAARIVRKMGLFRYAAMHVRRNELQYKQEFVGSAQMLANAKALLVEGEAIYLATDEQDKSFFDAMRQGGHKVFFLSDFPEEVKGVDKHKLGIVEQIICAGGRIFFGTGHSTFSSFIYRLRGYMVRRAQRSLSCVFVPLALTPPPCNATTRAPPPRCRCRVRPSRANTTCTRTTQRKVPL